jgi:hypothetical protein
VLEVHRFRSEKSGMKNRSLIQKDLLIQRYP